MTHDPVGFLVIRRSDVENLNLMVTAVINLDFVPLFFFFFLYSALEIFIARTMEDFRYRTIEIDEEFEDDEELEGEEFEEDDDDRERDEHSEGIVLHTDLHIFNTDDDFEDDDDDDEEGEEDSIEDDSYEDEEEEELFPVVRMLHTDSIEEDDYEEDEDYGEEDEDYEEEEEVEELFPRVEMTSSRVSSSNFRGRSLQGGIVINNSVVENSNDSEPCEGEPVNQENCGGELNGSFCPICFEVWTSGGEHQICCLPCGHIYGLSCIEKWLQQSRSSGKCPQCNNICTIKDVRVLYASRLCVADEELQKRVRSLEARCAYLEQKAGPLTPNELIDQICSNPAAVQRLATVLAGLYQQPVSP